MTLVDVSFILAAKSRHYPLYCSTIWVQKKLRSMLNPVQTQDTAFALKRTTKLTFRKITLGDF